VCYHLIIASPLTLSEVRSMLPPGLTADPLPSTEVSRFRSVLPTVQTAASLRVGACSCDLVRARLADPREDERHLRARYRSLGLPRERIIRALEHHRYRGTAIEPPAGWRAALAEFVAEHARNAGPTLFRLSFLPAGEMTGNGPQRSTPGGKADVAPLTRRVPEVRAGPEHWLEEGPPIVVLR
jgi:hypothetical protein